MVAVRDNKNTTRKEIEKMTREQALAGWTIIDYRIPRKGDTVLKCDNHMNHSVGKVSSNCKFIFAYILEKTSE